MFTDPSVLLPLLGAHSHTERDRLTAILVWRSLINLRRLNKRVTDPTFSSDLFSQFGAGSEDASHLSFRRPSGLVPSSRLSSHDDTVE